MLADANYIPEVVVSGVIGMRTAFYVSSSRNSMFRRSSSCAGGGTGADPALSVSMIGIRLM